MKRFAFLLFVICSFSLGTTGKLAALSSGVAIPCYYKHFKYLDTLLTALAIQTRLPDEVIIALSQTEHLPKEDMDILESKPWPFRVEIIRRTGIFMEGANRTAAAKHCSTDIVLCIDADDVPHPQRIEAVLQLFETLPDAAMVLCGHAYCPGQAIICEPAIPFFTPEEYSKMRFMLGSHTWLQLCKSDLVRWESGVHNGSPSLRRSLLQEDFYWSDLKNGADLAFNRLVFTKNYTTYLIQLPLLHYFNARSSGADVGRSN